MKSSQVLELGKTIENDLRQTGVGEMVLHPGDGTMEELRKILSQKISELIEKDFNRLINALYRIDIGEEKAAEAFASDNRELLPAKLADLIIERQLQKIELRKKYRSGKI